MMERREFRQGQRALLEDFLNSYLLAEPNRLPSIRKHQVENNFEFYCEYFATFGTAIPREKILVLKQVIRSADESGDAELSFTIGGSVPGLIVPSATEPAKEHAVVVMDTGEDLKGQAAEDHDLVDAQRKIVDAARKDSANKKLQKMEKKAETGGERPVKKDGAPKPKGKAKAKAKACQPNDNEPGEPAAAAAAPAAPAAPAAAAAPAARPPAVVAEPEFLTNIGDSWEEVAEVLKKAKVIIPDGFAGLRKSYTLDLDTSKVQVLWHEAGIYVKTSTGAGGFKVDGKGGTTISIRKYGG
ncbi:unnamed protein product, partial [Symbiodinium microadriaticum]